MKLIQLLVITSILTFESSAFEFLNKRAWDYGTSDITNYFKSDDKDESTKTNEDGQTKESPVPEEPKLSSCSATNPLTGGFFDLSELSSINKENLVAWSAKGHDYNKNFTLGVCSSPLKPNVELNNNLDGHFAKYQINSSEVGGYYVDEFGDKFSIGNFNSTPVFRGRKLTLSYHNGSYCPNGIDKKSTILSFICDKEILAKATVSFVGVLHDCDYFFEVRTVHACPTAQKADNLALIWIFLFIFLAAFLVYCSGGFLYKRIVLNRRGWRQLPNYGLGSKVTSALSGGWSRRNSSRGAISLNSSDRFGFIEDQNDLIDSLDVESD